MPVSAVRFRLWAPKYRETPRNNVSLGFFIVCDLMASGPFLDQGHKSSQSPPPSARHLRPLRPRSKTASEDSQSLSIRKSQKRGNTPNPRIQLTSLPEPLRGQIGTINNSAIHRAIEVTRYARRLQVTPHLFPRRLRLMERLPTFSNLCIKAHHGVLGY